MLLLLTDIRDVLRLFHVVVCRPKEEEMKCNNLQLNVLSETTQS